MKKMQTPKTSRQIDIADAIWIAFEQMADEMGSDRDGLVNQAMFMFARLNGFLMPGGAVQIAAPAPVPEAQPTGDSSAEQDFGEHAVEEEALNADFDADLDFEEAESPEPEAHAEEDFAAEEAPPAPEEDDFGAPPAHDDFEAEEEAPEAEEEDLLDEPPPPPRRASTPPRRASMSPRRRKSQPEEDFGAMDDDPDRKAVAERVLETAAELEKLIKGKGMAPAVPEDAMDDSMEEGMFEPTPVGLKVDGGDAELYLFNKDDSLERIDKDRFIIGRGKHCDLVINSGKVSREHAVVTHEDGAYFIEDLGSSNGTWFNKQRIKRRQIEDGDEYFICADKVKFALR